MKDAFKDPRLVRPGCQHLPGTCRCDIPFHLRQSTPVELYHQVRYSKVGHVDEQLLSNSFEPPTEPVK